MRKQKQTRKDYRRPTLDRQKPLALITADSKISAKVSIM